ncbi:hypothetical protein NHH03_22030 [Stieleria sp. TO1_6]|uniref:hypothetical protein n=1 Tax=Stieleria tagensis TaxID=2956795 RepID=UPI00209B4891|nr:hypothetical protein [Stieleria tagensis]MCO8124434.1 hypothetical protein [Stieleria tagensis]
MISAKLNQVLLGLGAAVLLASSGCHGLSHRSAGGGCDRPVCDVVDGHSDGGEPLCDELNDQTDGCDSLAGWNSHQIVRGRPNRFLDEFGSAFGVVNKLALWDRRADNHQISPQTEREILSYLRRNQLDSVLVRSNQYDPLGEWQRMVDNKRIAAPWKYTVGTYDWLRYTLAPGRLVGGDWYSPFTDTVHLYSDIPSIGLAKAAYAKDVHSRSLPGTYAAGQGAPLLGMWHESLANKEVLNYLKQSGSPAKLKEAERILYPDFAGALGAQVLGFLPYGSIYGRAAGALTGHAYRGITQAGSTVQTARSDTTLTR